MSKHDSATGKLDDGQDLESPPGHYLKLALLCLAIAMAVIIAFVLLTPPDPVPDELDSPASANRQEPAPKEAVPTASITPTTAPVEVPNEQLQAELIKEIETLQTRFPRSPQALHVAAGAYSKIHQTTKAGEVWEKCIELDRQHAGPRLGMATLLSERGEDRKAIEMLQGALADGCVSAELYYRLASAQSKIGEVEAAEETMKTGVAAFPSVAINWLLLGQTQNQLQKFDEAETSLRKSIALGNKSSAALFALANACQRQGKSEEAAKYRQQFSELRAKETETNKDKPFQEIYQQALRPIVTGTLASAAAIFAEQGDADQAERLFLRANALEPGNRQVLEELATFYRKHDRIADARVVQERLVAIQPKNAVYHINLASLASQLGDTRVAAQSLEQARTLNPNDPLPYIGLAQLKLQSGNLQQARQYALNSLRRGQTVQALALLAAICRQQGDMRTAEAAQQAAEDLASTNNDASTNNGAGPQADE